MSERSVRGRKRRYNVYMKMLSVMVKRAAERIKK